MAERERQANIVLCATYFRKNKKGKTKDDLAYTVTSRYAVVLPYSWVMSYKPSIFLKSIFPKLIIWNARLLIVIVTFRTPDFIITSRSNHKYLKVFNASASPNGA